MRLLVTVHILETTALKLQPTTVMLPKYFESKNLETKNNSYFPSSEVQAVPNMLCQSRRTETSTQDAVEHRQPKISQEIQPEGN